MLNKLEAFARQQGMLVRGDRITCAVSGGADSMALLWAMYLLKDKWQFCLSAAHFNHHLRGEESQRDAEFVERFCRDYNIDFVCGQDYVKSGPKGLEAAAREARYAFFSTLPGKVATAHTADDNAETVLMHLVRGTGLKGLGGICPVRENLIRPMLTVTRQEVLAFLEEYSIPYVEDSSNREDVFLRNRLRHHVMPLLQRENTCLSENLSAMAMRLRQDAQALDWAAAEQYTDSVEALKTMEPAIRNRVLITILTQAGVREPEASHIAAVNALLESDNPSARAAFPGGISVSRRYDRLCWETIPEELSATPLTCPGAVELPNLRILCLSAETATGEAGFTVAPCGEMVVRARQTGDTIRLPGGSKSLKKLFIDRKIPAALRQTIPVIADEKGVLAVYGIGVNLDRVSETGVRIHFVNKSSDSDVGDRKPTELRGKQNGEEY
ncbi:MAG: tRNA lysidine(34) synthetase TilS [Oscillospiraceae bacterium]|nr:tRNA lysidine(34) synthetase TilS [Oscillospiraceae bacterium]